MYQPQPFAGPLPFFDFGNPSHTRARWPYALATLSALVLAAGSIVVALIGDESARLLRAVIVDPNFERSIANLNVVFRHRSLAYEFLIAGHVLALVAGLGLAAHGHRTGVALLGSLAFLLAMTAAMLVGGNNGGLVALGMFGSIAGLAGYGFVRGIGIPARIAIFAGAVIALGQLASGTAVVAPIAAAVGYLAVAVRAWRLRVAPF